MRAGDAILYGFFINWFVRLVFNPVGLFVCMILVALNSQYQASKPKPSPEDQARLNEAEAVLNQCYEERARIFREEMGRFTFCTDQQYALHDLKQELGVD